MSQFFTPSAGQPAPFVGNLPQSSPPPQQRPAPRTVNGLLAGLQTQFDEFNESGEEQFRRIKAISDAANRRILGDEGLFAQAGGLLDTMGERQGDRIDEESQAAIEAAAEEMDARGLGGSGLIANAERGIETDAEDAQRDLQERVDLARSGLLERQAGMTSRRADTTVDTVLSRQNQSPNVDAFTGLLQQLSASGGDSSPPTASPAPSPSKPKRPKQVKRPKTTSVARPKKKKKKEKKQDLRSKPKPRRRTREQILRDNRSSNSGGRRLSATKHGGGKRISPYNAAGGKRMSPFASSGDGRRVTLGGIEGSRPSFPIGGTVRRVL